MSSTTPSPDDSQRRPEGNLGHPEQRRDDVFDQVGEVAPGWGEQPQDAYEQGDSGGWGAPGQHDTGPLRLGLGDSERSGDDEPAASSDDAHEPGREDAPTTAFPAAEDADAGTYTSGDDASTYTSGDDASTYASGEDADSTGQAQTMYVSPEASPQLASPSGPQGYDQAAYPAAGQGEQAFDQQRYGQTGYGETPYGQPGDGETGYEGQGYEEQRYGPSGYGPPQGPHGFGQHGYPAAYGQGGYTPPGYGSAAQPGAYGQPGGGPSGYAAAYGRGDVPGGYPGGYPGGSPGVPPQSYPQSGPLPVSPSAQGARYASGPTGGYGRGGGSSGSSGSAGGSRGSSRGPSERARGGMRAMFDFSFARKATHAIAPLLFWLVVAWGVFQVLYVLVTLAGAGPYGPSGGEVFLGVVTALFDALLKIALARVFLELAVNVADLAERTRTETQ